ncbi:MAG TPA: hypothetical protein VFK05_07665 [Polyangiaceae bacterium]|nr:hypothetical protein [Polyangiaceae bacterium]
MLLAFLVAVLSVLLGAALSFVPSTSRAVLGYMRTFATLAAVAVVVTHLLPEALRELGPLSILLFLAGWFAPALAHFIGQRTTSGRTQHAVLEAGYWGLVVHHVADGIGLGAYTRLPSAQGSHWDVIVALAAHTVPLIAVVSLAYRTTFGARAAVLRSLGLAVASVAGILLSRIAAASTIESYSPIIAAVAAGLLLHVVTHDLTEDPAQGPLARSLDLVVAGFGVAVSLLGAWDSTEPGTRQFGLELWQLTQRTALVILVALLVAAFALRLPDRHSKWARATSPAGTLGAESILLSIALLGFTAAGLRILFTSLALAFAANPATESRATEAVTRRHWRARVSEAVETSGPWLVLGLLIGALLTSVPPSALQRASAGVVSELLLVALVANLTPVAAPAAVLIAAGLAGLGLSAGAILLFATLAPIADVLKSAFRARALVTALSLALALAADQLGLSTTALDRALSEGESGLRAALALCLLLLFGVWQRSARLWLSTIVRPPPHEHEHAHDVHGPHETHELHHH